MEITRKKTVREIIEDYIADLKYLYVLDGDEYYESYARSLNSKLDSGEVPEEVLSTVL